MPKNKAASLFSSAPPLDALELSEAESLDLFGAEWREIERDDTDGRLLSFFTGAPGHVVFKAKEWVVLRPHGLILRTGTRLTPDGAALTSAVWMAGVFHSGVIQGQTGGNRFLSVIPGHPGLFRSHGQRLFVELPDGWALLDVPSAFEMRPAACRWWYKYPGGLIEVRSEALSGRHELTLAVNHLAGPPRRFLISHHVAPDGDAALPVRFERDGDSVSVQPIPDGELGRRFPEGGFRLDFRPGNAIERLGGDELLFADGLSRHQPFLCFLIAPATSFVLRLTGRSVRDSDSGNHTAAGTPDEHRHAMAAGLRLHPPSDSPLAGDTARLAEILPWFFHDALIHYLAPRGLEHFSGNGWSTRDLTQGPVEMLLTLGRFEPLRDLLIRVFGAQNPDGDWPQWFTCFDRERHDRVGDSHEDIVFWPLLALAHYLLATEDATLLDEVLPFFHPEDGDRAERATLWEHLERALQVIGARLIWGTRLVAHGNGGRNDSSRSADAPRSERSCSAWTVTLHYRTFTALAQALRRLGEKNWATSLEAMAAGVLGDFQQLLIADGILAGFALFEDDEVVDYRLHPRDGSSGSSYSLPPMIQAIAHDLFDPEQARTHLALIKRHLSGPGGARLSDRSRRHQDGPETPFRRTDGSGCFGREPGFMHSQAHLHYAEALWRYGDAQGFFHALCQINPIGAHSRGPASVRRQANCYYSGADAAFHDCYQADTEHQRISRSEIPPEGSWRVHPSGPGIGLGLILRCFLGLRREASRLVLDPVMPPELDGLHAELELAGQRFEIVYRIGSKGCGPHLLNLNGIDLAFIRGTNPYRLGAAEVPMATLRNGLHEGVNRLEVRLG